MVDREAYFQYTMSSLLDIVPNITPVFIVDSYFEIVLKYYCSIDSRLMIS